MLTGYQAVPFTDESKEDWDRFVDVCPEAWLNHRSDLIQRSLDNQSYADFSFSIRHDGRIVGVCVLTRFAVGLGASLSGPGLALSPHVNRKEAGLCVDETIRRFAEKHNCQALRFHLSPLAPGLIGQRYHESTLAELGFSFGVRGDDLNYQAAYVNMINLRKTLGEILQDFTKGNRNNVVKCASAPVHVEFDLGCDVEDKKWSEFVDLHKATFKRNSLTPFDEDRLKRLRAAISSGYIVLARAYERDACIASVMLERYKGGLHYAVGCCDERALKMGAMAYIHYAAMEWGKTTGCNWYCMGTTCPMVKGDYGDFKKRFGGEKYDLLSGELILDAQAHMRKIILPAAFGIAGLLPSSLKRVARTGRRIALGWRHAA